MAITVLQAELSEEFNLTNVRVQIVQFRGDGSYPTGGTPGIAALFGFQQIYCIIPLQKSGYIWEYNPDTNRIKMYQQPAAASQGASPQVNNGANLNGVTFRGLVLGQ